MHRSVVPGAFLIDVLPELENVPFYDTLSGWKKLGDEINQKDAAVFAYFWNKMKRLRRGQHHIVGDGDLYRVIVRNMGLMRWALFTLLNSSRYASGCRCLFVQDVRRGLMVGGL